MSYRQMKVKIVCSLLECDAVTKRAVSDILKDHTAFICRVLAHIDENTTIL